MFGLPFKWFLPMLMSAVGGGIVAAQNMGTVEEGIAHGNCKTIGWYWNDTANANKTWQRSWRCSQ